MDDALPALLARDVDAGFERLVVAFQDRIYGLGLTLTGSPADAEEVAQDTFVRAHRALRRYGPERIGELKLRAWLHRIALNVVRNRVRVRRVATVSLDAAWAVGDDVTSRPEAVVMGRASAAEMRALVASLPVGYRDAVVLRHVQQLSYAEAAEALGRPVGTVKANVHRGLGLLRLALEAREVV
ncbi:MAG TPA: RNA polymerase sigma factor [Candidatus Angelobacter sp.]|jgi:RNA polymerase sigma factor (sigma-70 family)|nr:RNA polymerase sigma factor [Candidatus Angelobacter sp.]